jgi:hypothetical protein
LAYAVDIRGIPPGLAVRDRLKDAQAEQILVRNGTMSIATMSLRAGLDPEQEEQLVDKRKNSLYTTHNVSPQRLPSPASVLWASFCLSKQNQKGPNN